MSLARCPYCGTRHVVKYGFTKTLSLLEQMMFIILYLITGKLSLGMLSGPVGIYNVVGTAASAGWVSLLSLLALISINVGFINLIPFPAFDGGRVLFLIIEKIKGSPINSKIENICHSIGFILLILSKISYVLVSSVELAFFVIIITK